MLNCVAPIAYALFCVTRFLSSTKYLSGLVYVDDDDWLALYGSSSTCLRTALAAVRVFVLDEALGRVRLNTWILS